MKPKYIDQNTESALRAENDFLKMKLMLENGARFGGSPDIDPALENIFLNNIIQFEKQFNEKKFIKVFDKLGKPVITPLELIDEAEIDEHWQSLNKLMLHNGIQLNAASKKVTARELYHFSTEILFNEEIEEFDIPNLVSCFLYEDFFEGGEEEDEDDDDEESH